MKREVVKTRTTDAQLADYHLPLIRNVIMG